MRVAARTLELEDATERLAKLVADKEMLIVGPSRTMGAAIPVRRRPATKVVVFHSAGIQDRDEAALVLHRIRTRFPWLELVWADAGYDARQVKAAVAKLPVLRMEIVRRSDDQKGFKVQPRRWVVERTFSCFGRNRRLAKDYENLAATLAAFVAIAAVRLALRRLARLA